MKNLMKRQPTWLAGIQPPLSVQVYEKTWISAFTDFIICNFVAILSSCHTRMVKWLNEPQACPVPLTACVMDGPVSQ